MNRDFKGVWIPKSVWTNTELSWMEKLFIVEIDSLDNENNCFASNSYFAEFFQLSKPRCTQIIKSLETKGYLKVSLEWKGKAVTKRTILVNKEKIIGSKNTKLGSKNTKQGSKNTKQGVVRILKDNNTVLFNNTINKNLKENLKVETKNEDSEYIDFTSTIFKKTGAAKGLFQRYLGVLVFTTEQSKLTERIYYRISNDLKAFNTKRGVYDTVTDEMVLKGLELALKAFFVKVTDKTKRSIKYFNACLNVSDYVVANNKVDLLSHLDSKQMAVHNKNVASKGEDYAIEVTKRYLTQTGKI